MNNNIPSDNYSNIKQFCEQIASLTNYDVNKVIKSVRIIKASRPYKLFHMGDVVFSEGKMLPIRSS